MKAIKNIGLGIVASLALTAIAVACLFWDNWNPEDDE